MLFPLLFFKDEYMLSGLDIPKLWSRASVPAPTLIKCRDTVQVAEKLRFLSKMAVNYWVPLISTANQQHIFFYKLAKAPFNYCVSAHKYTSTKKPTQYWLHVCLS